MLVSIYKLQMLVVSVPAWQLGLCLVYFSATLTLGNTRGYAFIYLFILNIRLKNVAFG